MCLAVRPSGVPICLRLCAPLWVLLALLPSSTTLHMVAMLPAWLVYISTVGQSPGNPPWASDESTVSRLRPPELLASCQAQPSTEVLHGARCPVCVFWVGAPVHMPCTAAGQVQFAPLFVCLDCWLCPILLYGCRCGSLVVAPEEGCYTALVAPGYWSSRL